MWEEICELYKDLQPRLIILFGSYARGDYTEESDIDILIVSDKLSTDPREAFIQTFKPKGKIIPTAFNTSVFLKKLKEGSTFLLEILEDGKILCGDEEFIAEVKRIYDDIRKRYKRKGKVWYWN
ncbi:nucleotidyltransferase domain-containing protein [Sulfurisphaera javensis]|uniref:Nucleotidyltransferase domain-containing protein n=1 Tax=Sulfurisphaera javensis TaxID=2049879 RepID=A0AAT9GT15_9CREN